MSKVNLDFSKELPQVEETGTVIACFQYSACVADCPAAAENIRNTDRVIVHSEEVKKLGQFDPSRLVYKASERV